MESVIQEIANQLGMAASEVEGHVAELFPLVSSAMAGKAIGEMALCGIFLVLSFAAVVWCLVLSAKDFGGSDDTLAGIFIVALIVFGVSLVASCYMIPNGITYIVSPEGATIVHFAEMMTK